MGELTTDGHSRRDLIKKGALAGGIVWAAPVLLSSPAAAAAEGSPVPGSISNVIVGFTCSGTYYAVKYETGAGGVSNVTNFNGEGNDCHEDAGGTVSTFDGTGLVTFTKVESGNTVTSVTATAEGCTISTIAAKCGSSCTNGTPSGSTAMVGPCS